MFFFLFQVVDDVCIAEDGVAQDGRSYGIVSSDFGKRSLPAIEQASLPSWK